MALYIITYRAFLFRTNDQKTNIVEMCITGYGIMDNSIHSTWKSQSAAFPRPANSVSHNSISKAVIHIPTMPTATTKTAPSLSFIHKSKNLKGGITIRNVNTGYMIRAPTPPAQHTAAEAAALTTEYRRAADI